MISKSILAVAIAAASTSAFAVAYPDYNFNFSAGNPQLELNTGNYNNVTLGGSTTITGDTDNDAINLNGLAIEGDLTFTGSINGNGEYADGIDLDRSGEGSGPGTVVEGKFRNSGQIKVNGFGSIGILADSAQLRGGFENSGTISASGSHEVQWEPAAIGIEFTNSYVGGFKNTGKISATGHRAKGVRSLPNDSDLDTGAGFTGNFENDGEIIADGARADALSLVDTTIAGGVINRGTLSANGVTAEAIDLDGALIDFILNQGTIKATGAGSNGIMVDNARVASLVPAENSGIINYGVISGEQNGIAVSSYAGALPGVQIQHRAGSIEGGANAIKGDNHASLQWTGGKIVGNLIELTGVNIQGGDLLFQGDVIQAATINLQTGKLTLDGVHSTFMGDLNLASGTTLEMKVGSGTMTSAPILYVQGGMTVESGSTVALKARSENFRAASTSYKVIEATSGITGHENIKLVSSSAMLKIDSYVADENGVTAVVTARSDSALRDSVRAGGGNPNAANALVPFANSVMGKMSESDPLFTTFGNATTDAELARLAKQLAPEMNSGSNTAAMNGQSLVNGALSNRSAAGRGASGGDLLKETGLWIQALNTDADQDMRNGIEGFNADSTGFAIGADGKLSDETTVGFAYSYLTTDVKSDSGNKTDVKGHALTLYGNWALDNWFADASLTYGKGDNESKRFIAGTQAKGSYDSDLLGLNAAAGYTYSLSDSLLVEPQVAARYSNVKSDGYTEKGSAAALNIGAQRFEIGEVGAGARVAGSYALGNGVIEPEAKVMLWHDVIGDSASTTSSFVLGGSAFTNHGAVAARNSIETGLGVQYKVGAWSVGANYNHLTKTDFSANTYSAKVRYDF
jgi:outer membrane autotransporter protein